MDELDLDELDYDELDYDEFFIKIAFFQFLTNWSKTPNEFGLAKFECILNAKSLCKGTVKLKKM